MLQFLAPHWWLLMQHRISQHVQSCLQDLQYSGYRRYVTITMLFHCLQCLVYAL